MEQKKLDRINEFARRVKAGETLTPAELAERDALRREYIASVKASLVGTWRTPTLWSQTAPGTGSPKKK